MRRRKSTSVYRRAILIYMVAIVAPSAVLLWLGIQTFERQHQSYVTLASERLSAELEARIHAAASAAFADSDQPIAKAFFVIERGRVIRPGLHTPLRLPIPESFTEADQQELTQNRPELGPRVLSEASDIASTRESRVVRDSALFDQAGT